MGKGERSRVETQAHNFSGGQKENRGGTTGEMGEGEGGEEGWLEQRSLSLASFCIAALQKIIGSFAAFHRCRE